ncbi:MAG: hypothetical protein HOP08_19055 [Cyclobacteriaceae bacterium]|nr:hypothetical protein [Cyclobacteriaceae bacterium]
MQIKDIKPVNFLFFRTETRVSELAKFLPVSQEIFREAVLRFIPITGPVHWHYTGLTDMEKPFTLEVCVPVAGIPKEYDGLFHFKRTDSFKCVAVIHEGSWDKLPDTYGKIFAFLGENKLQPSGVHRELYINVDFTHPEANTTEVQFGIL